MSKDQVKFLHELAVYHYNSILNSEQGEYARKYLGSRGIPLEIANNFLVGCSDKFDGNTYTDSLFRYLRKYSSTGSILKSGLVSEHDIKEQFVLNDTFNKGRIILPLLQYGKPGYITSRATYDSRLKHKHLKGNRTNFNIFNYDCLINGNDTIYITEGIFDALSLATIGLSAIATLGTRGISIQHEEYFSGSSKTFVFVYDNDENGAGDEAVRRSASILKSFGVNKMRQIVLPRPESYPKVDVNQLLTLCVEKNKNFRNFFVELELKEIEAEPYRKRIQINESDVPILKVVAEYVTDLQQVNETTYKAKCPFPDHDDKDPSFMVFTKTSTYKCFGKCQRFGGPIRFLMDYLNITYKEAVEKLSAIT